MRLVIDHEEVPCGGGHRRTVGLQQASYGGAVAAQIEQEGAHVRRGLHQHDEERVGVEDRNDRKSPAELEDRGREVAASAGIAKLRHVLDRGWQERGDAVGIDAVGHTRIDGQPVTAHHYYGVYAVGTAERLHYIADRRHTVGQRRFPGSRSQAVTAG